MTRFGADPPPPHAPPPPPPLLLLLFLLLLLAADHSARPVEAVLIWVQAALAESREERNYL